MRINDMLSQEAKLRLPQGGEEKLLRSWERLSSAWNLRFVGARLLGVQGAVLDVWQGNRKCILKICTVPHVFKGQDAALAGAPKGTVPAVLAKAVAREAWLLERLPGVSGKRGYIDWREGAGVVAEFHKGRALEGLWDLLDYHMRIAEECQEERVLALRDYFRSIHSPENLVHGDLLPENIIFGPKQEWLVDPTGYRGDQAFDWAVLMLYSQTPLAIEEVARFSGYSSERLAAWAWLRASLDRAQLRRLRRPHSEMDRIVAALENKFPGAASV